MNFILYQISAGGLYHITNSDEHWSLCGTVRNRPKHDSDDSDTGITVSKSDLYNLSQVCKHCKKSAL